MHIRFILDERTFDISSDHELAVTFDLLARHPSIAPILHWEIIMQIPDQDLMTLIRSHRSLVQCLRPLNDKNRFIFLFKIGDRLAEIIGNAKHLGEILANIPEENDKAKLVKQIRPRGFARIVKSVDDLSHILPWISGKWQATVLELIGKETLLRLLPYAEDAARVLTCLDPENKKIFLSLFTYSHLLDCIKTTKWFFLVFQSLPDSIANEFLDFAGPQRILEMIEHQSSFEESLRRISIEKERLICSFLKQKEQ